MIRVSQRRRLNIVCPQAGISAADLDHVGFYEKPFLKFERLLETYVATAPLGIRSFFKSIPIWLQKKLHLPREMRKSLGGGIASALSLPSTTNRMQPVPFFLHLSKRLQS